MTGKHMAQHDPSPDIDPRYLTYGDKPEPENEPVAWQSEESYAYDGLDQPVSDDPLAFADEHMARLGLTLDFGPGDLACNREGELSPAQMARLHNDLRLFCGPMIVVPAIFALLFVVMAAGIGLGTLVILLLLLAGVAVIPAFLLNRERQRLPDRVVLGTTMRMGGFALTVRRWGLSDENSLPVDGGKPVFAPKHLYKVLRSNQTYLVYYAPVRTWRGYRLLSLEPHGGPAQKSKRKAKPSQWQPWS